MKTDKKIEEIIDKKFETCWVDKRSAIGHIHKDRIEELKSELNTELQKAVEEAVEGFVKWLKNIEVSRQSADTQELLDSSIRAETMEQALYKVLPKLAKQYLESEGK